MVGNSAVLNRFRFGRAIDAHHAVFRVNQAPTRGYAANVGRRATFRVLNKAWSSHYTTYAGYKRLLPDLEDNVTLLTTRTTAREYIRLANATAAARPDVRLFYVSQQALVGARQSLTNYRLGVERLLSSSERSRAPEAKRTAEKLKRRIESYKRGGMSPSTGMITFYIALGMCARVTTFGFSMEISRDYKSSTWRYHYFQHYDDAPDLRAHPSHSFTLEGDLLMDLSKQHAGIGVCTTAPRGVVADFGARVLGNATMEEAEAALNTLPSPNTLDTSNADDNRTEASHTAGACPAWSDPDPPDPFKHDYTADELGRLDMKDLYQLSERVWSGKGANPDDPTGRRRCPTSRTTRERIISRLLAWISQERPRWLPPAPPLSLEEATQQHMAELVQGVSEDRNSRTAERMGAILQKMGRGGYVVKPLQEDTDEHTNLPGSGFGDRAVDDLVLKETLGDVDNEEAEEDEEEQATTTTRPRARSRGGKLPESTLPASASELRAQLRNMPKLSGWTKVGTKLGVAPSSRVNGRGPYNVGAFHQIVKFGGGKPLDRKAPGSGGIGFGDLDIPLKSLGVGGSGGDPLSSDTFRAFPNDASLLEQEEDAFDPGEA